MNLKYISRLLIFISKPDCSLSERYLNIAYFFDLDDSQKEKLLKIWAGDSQGDRYRGEE
jgi:hypothetical protein